MGRYPYLVNPGPHAYMIVNVGETEKAQISKEPRLPIPVKQAGVP
jgi:hypothetical protein